MAASLKTRSVYFAFSLLMGAALTGCGGGGGGDSKTAAANPPAAETPAPSAATPSPFDPMPSTPSTPASPATPADEPATGSNPTPETTPAPAPAPVSSPAPAPSAEPVAVAGNAIQWTPPLENDDGSFVSDLAGYTIVYGPSSTVLHNSVRVENPSLSSYVLDSLPKGTYYVAVKAVNSDGIESATSNVVKMVL